MEYMSAREAGDKWGISQRRVAVLCSEKRIPNAIMVGNMWIIPAMAKKPIDKRRLRYKEKQEKDNCKKVKPFLKWAGGKGQLISEIEKYYPFDNKKIVRYAEPFVGGGAVFFDILNRYKLEEIYISDTNQELINTYKIIKNNVDDLIESLDLLQNNYIPLDNENRKTYYIKKREIFNNLKINKDDDTNIEKASLMIFLNRTCFNGLYRVNKKGFFNVPMGKYKNPLICDEANLRNISDKLQNTIIVCDDYKKSDKFIDDQTFLYIDPPYRPITGTSNFTAYTKELFGDKEQIELAKFVEEMNKKGAKILLSNSDPKNVNIGDDFFEKLYLKFTINRVKATRMINSKSESRGKISELLITNI